MITADHKNAVVLDYFAGSGTTGHAVVELNREDNGQRKYILVEMGRHFNDVILPRMKKLFIPKIGMVLNRKVILMESCTLLVNFLNILDWNHMKIHLII
nr:DNA methyltransferase [Legionella tunisiensis]